ncbi:MAG: efflux RND transporter periplasmic adaptor subunit [Chlamydiota bacterium]|nr:efflux RND transporter periplasmic adaptor subunit [Chlamydiota bacterium]
MIRLCLVSSIAIASFFHNFFWKEATEPLFASYKNISYSSVIYDTNTTKIEFSPNSIYELIPSNDTNKEIQFTVPLSKSSRKTIDIQETFNSSGSSLKRTLSKINANLGKSTRNSATDIDKTLFTNSISVSPSSKNEKALSDNLSKLTANLDKLDTRKKSRSDITLPNDDMSPYIEEYSKKILPKTKYPVVLHPKQKTQLYAEVDAPIEKILFYMGETFNKGDTLIEIKKDRFIGQYEKTVSFQEKAEAELIATQDLYDDYIASEFELKEAKAKVAEAKADLIFAKDDLSSTTIKAPYSGRVVSVFAEEYELPPTNKQLIEIIDDHTLIAKLLVKVENLQDLKIGKEITITLSSTGNDITAVITRIGAMVDPSSSTIKVEAEVDNSDGKLKAGMIGTASLSQKNKL